MVKSLVIAEKPSVALDIIRALGGFKKEGDYYESQEFVVASAVGHLLEICPPPGVEPARGKWSISNLPVLPREFDLQPQEKTKAKLKTLLNLLKRADIGDVVNACDAGREGELIFRHIIRYAKCKKPIKRLWLQSMTQGAIRDGFEKLRPGEELESLASAAKCRAEADWIVGINGTRAMTSFNSREGGFLKTTVGRVQTPTLTMIVEREEQITSFISKPYYELHAFFSQNNVDYSAVWFDEKFRKGPADAKDLKADRIWSKEDAETIRKRCLGRDGIVTEESKRKQEYSQMLFDLTSLQREVNARFGFSAKRTLQIAQSLYEKHKMLTYPRTDSRCLPEDYGGTVYHTLEALKETSLERFASKIIDNRWVITKNRRIFNNAKISDHFAIIPTGLIKNLDGDDARIYDLVVKRFLSVFYPPVEYEVTTRYTRIGEDVFKTEGRVIINPGWREIYGADSDTEPVLQSIDLKKAVLNKEIEIKELATKPPARFTEASLLNAMETAGKFVEDEELRDAMNEKGLGTPATRAAIIEGLISETYIQRLGKELVPSTKAFDLITMLRALKLEELCSPELTGNWEYKLKQMEHRDLSPDDFMNEIRTMTISIVDKVRESEKDVSVQFPPMDIVCPRCGKPFTEELRKYTCSGCDFAIWKTIASRRIEREELAELFAKEEIGPLDGFVSKLGRKFSAKLKLTKPDWKVEFDFGNPEQTEKKTLDFSQLKQIGICPLCKGGIFETENAWTCQNTAERGKKHCVFRTGKVVLGQHIDLEQIQKLLTQGKTDMLENFFSEKRKKKFTACLKIDSKKGTTFEFDQNPGRSAAAKRTTKTIVKKKRSITENVKSEID